MTEQQRKTKLIVMKILSLACLVVILVSGFLPWVTLDGDYKDGIFGEFSAIVDDISDEDIDTMQALLDEKDIDIDVEDFVDSIDELLDPVTDGGISPTDFLLLSVNFAELGDVLDELSELEDEEGKILAVDDEGTVLFEVISTVFIGAFFVFGVLAVAVIVRMILRIFNRKGRGVFIVILSLLNMGFMAAISLVLNELLSESTDATASLSAVPVVVLVCSILGCIFWGRARKLLNPVVVVQQPVNEEPVAYNPSYNAAYTEPYATENAYTDVNSNPYPTNESNTSDTMQ